MSVANTHHSLLEFNCTSEPFPQRRTILGGPSKALNIMVMRPLLGSCKWLMVSLPEPVRSMYQNVLSLISPKYFPPFGETLTSAHGCLANIRTVKSLYNSQSKRLQMEERGLMI